MFLISFKVKGNSLETSLEIFLALMKSYWNWSISFSRLFLINNTYIIFLILSSVGASTTKYNELYIIHGGSFSLLISFPLLKIPVKIKFPFFKTAPFGNKIVVPFSPKIDERHS